MGKTDTGGMKLYSGGKEVTKQQVEEAIAAYKEKVASPEYQKELEEYAAFRKGKPTPAQRPAPAPAREPISYYEFPNGLIVKSVPSQGVYRYCKDRGIWEEDPSLTAEFEWDMPRGMPCENLRQKVDLSCDLPAFPDENAFVPGNTVFIGGYPQKSPHDFSPIAWTVLEVTDNAALCISRDGLLVSGYCDPRRAYGRQELLWWENSLAREVCNRHFYDTAFSEGEKARLLPKEITGVSFGAGCRDAVFLLSEEEALRYFPQAYRRIAKPTPVARSQGAVSDRAHTAWWLLPEENAYGFADGSIYPKAVFPDGEIQFHGRNIYHTDFTIRPCILVQRKKE